MEITQILLSPFSWLLTFFYNTVGSYGVALILFALVVKIILFPFSLKGKKSMIQMNMLQGKMNKLQKQYGKDKERYNQAVQEMYAKEKVNPMGGCLWSMLPLCVLLPLYAIIRQPLKYMMGLDETAMMSIANAVDWNTLALSNGWIKDVADGFANSGYNQLYLASLITPENLSAAQAAAGDLGSGIFSINFDFLGLVNLAMVPELKFWTITGGFALFLLPLISACSGFFFSRITMKTNAMSQQSNNATANQTSRMMMWMSPLMSLWIGFAMPAGLCVYWIANNLLSMVQELISGKILKKDYEKAAAHRAEQERLEKEEEKAHKRQIAEERARRAEEEKANRGKKKAAALKEKEDDSKIPGHVKEASRVGMRQYARGRAYDPNRYGTPVEETVEEVTEETTPLALEETSVETAPVEAVEVATEDGALEAAYAPESEEVSTDDEKE